MRMHTGPIYPRETRDAQFSALLRAADRSHSGAGVMKKVTSAARLAEAYERLDAAAGKPGGALRRVGKTLSEPWLMTQLTLLLCLNLLHGLQQSTTGLLRYAVAGVLAHAVFSSTDAVSVFAENAHLKNQVSLTGGALSHLVTLVLSVEFFSVARLL